MITRQNHLLFAAQQEPPVETGTGKTPGPQPGGRLEPGHGQNLYYQALLYGEAKTRHTSVVWLAKAALAESTAWKEEQEPLAFLGGRLREKC